MFCVSMSLRFFMYVFIATRLAYFAQLHLCSLNIVPLWLNVMNLRPSYKTELVSQCPGTEELKPPTVGPTTLIFQNLIVTNTKTALE